LHGAEGVDRQLAGRGQRGFKRRFIALVLSGAAHQEPEQTEVKIVSATNRL